MTQTGTLTSVKWQKAEMKIEVELGRRMPKRTTIFKIDLKMLNGIEYKHC
ncbi:MAG: hypothetical protein J7K85_05045 [Anaerolineaceae bacterium]|nr:hypothetical protein [Anaerolineaceae bacterium]